MVALVIVSTFVVLLLGILVAGLLRSHADILRALHDLGSGVGDPSTALVLAMQYLAHAGQRHSRWPRQSEMKSASTSLSRNRHASWKRTWSRSVSR